MIFGHPLLSHPFELAIFGKKGIHEELGKRIMLENPEIQSVLASISPNLNDVLCELYNNDFLNFRQHDESNYDVDRLDYLSRDSLYLGFAIHLPQQKYISESSDGVNFIDVYDFVSLQEIEKLLELRENRYSNIYTSQSTQVIEKNIGNFLNAFLSVDSDVGTDLKNFLLNLKNKNIADIDLDEFISWDEIDLFSELLDIAEKHENPFIRDLATMIIPSMDSLLNLIYSHLNAKCRKVEYNDIEKNLLQKIRRLIKSDIGLSINLRNKNFVKNNIILLPDNVVSELEQHKNLITSCCFEIPSYDEKKPIYIKDISGKIFELSQHPNRKYNWNTRKTSVHFNFANIPYLKFIGLSNEEIRNLKSQSIKHSNSDLDFEKRNINMQPLQINHSIESIFLEL